MEGLHVVEQRSGLQSSMSGITRQLEARYFATMHGRIGSLSALMMKSSTDETRAACQGPLHCIRLVLVEVMNTLLDG